MLEHLAIANYLQKLEVATETPGRRYNKETFLSALESVEVQLNEEGEEERAQRRIDEALLFLLICTGSHVMFIIYFGRLRNH